jgi:hypothetical protein
MWSNQVVPCGTLQIPNDDWVKNCYGQGVQTPDLTGANDLTIEARPMGYCVPCWRVNKLIIS